MGKVTEFAVTGHAPGSMVAGPDGNLWFTAFSDTQPPAIGRITPVGAITLFSVGLAAGSTPTSIVVGPDGNLWFSDAGMTSAIGRITTGGTITEFSAGLRSGSYPTSLVAGPDGNVWFIDDPIDAPAAIGRITPTGTISEFSAGLDPGSTPTVIVAGPDGNLWFSDPALDAGVAAVGRITPAGTITEFRAGLHIHPASITAGPDGNLWFVAASAEPPAIGRITPTGTITEFSAGLRPDSLIRSVAAGHDGNLWFTDHQGLSSRSAAIGRITPDGTITEFSQCLHGGVPYTGPVGITAGPDGNMWFANITSRTFPSVGTPSTIGRITPSGAITEFGGYFTAFGPSSIVPGPDGNVWFTVFDLIGRITPPTAPVNVFTTRGARRDRTRGTALLPVVVQGPGSLTLTGRSVVARTRTPDACGTVNLLVRARGDAKAKLDQRGKVTVRFRITFTPNGGTTYGEARSLQLSKKLR